MAFLKRQEENDNCNCDEVEKDCCWWRRQMVITKWRWWRNRNLRKNMVVEMVVMMMMMMMMMMIMVKKSKMKIVTMVTIKWMWWLCGENDVKNLLMRTSLFLEMRLLEAWEGGETRDHVTTPVARFWIISITNYYVSLRRGSGWSVVVRKIFP